MSVFNALLDCWVMEHFSGLVSGCRNVVSLNTLLGHGTQHWTGCRIVVSLNTLVDWL